MRECTRYWYECGKLVTFVWKRYFVLIANKILYFFVSLKIQSERFSTLFFYCAVGTVSVDQARHQRLDIAG